MSEKTEQPTARRLRQARERGDSAVSAPLGQSLSFVVTLALLPGFVAALAGAVAVALKRAIASGAADVEGAGWLVLELSLPILAAGALASAASAFVQSGGVASAARLSPDLARLNPFSGIKGLFTLERLFSLLRSLLAALVIGALAYSLLRSQLASVAASAGHQSSIVELSWLLGRRLLWTAALVGLVLGGVDLLLVRRAWRARHKMTKDEVKREHRESEGDPELKAARKRAHQEALFGASIAAVKEASVLIVNPTHLATALRYREDEDEAPRVLAHGEGDLAQRLIAAAHAYGVPVVRDVPVAHALRDLEIGDQIPEALYEAVAEVLREIASGSQSAEGA